MDCIWVCLSFKLLFGLRRPILACILQLAWWLHHLELSRRAYADRTKPIDPAVFDNMKELTAEERTSGYQFNAYTLWAVMAGQIWPQGSPKFYRQVKIPTLLLSGTEDRLVTLDEEMETHFAIKISDLHRLPGSGHMCMIEDPDRVNRFIGDHIQKIRNMPHKPTVVTTQPNISDPLDGYDVNNGISGKLLRVKQPHIKDPVEFELLNQWWPEYKRQMAAIQDALKYCFPTNEKESSIRQKVVEEAFDDELIAINDKWNAEAKLMREDFYLKDFNEKIAETLIRRKEYDQMELERIEKLKKKLFSMKEYNETMVTRANIDSRLDEIMASEPINYNHAINERGNAFLLKDDYASPEFFILSPYDHNSYICARVLMRVLTQVSHKNHLCIFIHSRSPTYAGHTLAPTLPSPLLSYSLESSLWFDQYILA
ncbi:hypothetical protein ACTXT7_000425 [Hymenolepis weldensis]